MPISHETKGKLTAWIIILALVSSFIGCSAWSAKQYRSTHHQVGYQYRQDRGECSNWRKYTRTEWRGGVPSEVEYLECVNWR